MSNPAPEVSHDAHRNPPELTARALPYLTLGVAQIAVGAAAIFARFGMSGAQPLAVAALRLTIAASILLVAAALRMPGRITVGGSRWPVFVAAGIALAIHFGSWFWSLQYTTVAISTLLVSTTPIWTATYDALAGRRRIGLAGCGAFVVGATGLILVLQHNASPPPVRGHLMMGAALALLGAMTVAAYWLLIRGVRAEFDTRTIVTQTFTSAAIVLLVASALAHQGPPPLNNLKAWGGILALALISQMLGHTALNSALRWFSPSAIAFSTLLEPVVAALLALWLFGERLGPYAVVGGALILIAIGTFLRYEEQPSSG